EPAQRAEPGYLAIRIHLIVVGLGRAAAVGRTAIDIPLDRDLAKAEERAQQIDFAMIDAIGQPTVGVSGVGGLRRAGRYQKKRDSGNNRETGHGAIMATV